MGRLPFDPDRMRRQASREPERPDAPLTVSALASLIRAAVERGVPAKVRVIGEVSGARRSTHLYFSVKDDTAVLGAVIFASALRRLAFEPRDGQEVVLTGRVEYYAPQGRLTIIVDKVEPVGQGVHELRFRQLCEELRSLGWFEESRKRPLPLFPRSVAVVTSRTGAALQDVLSTMASRCPAVGVVVVPVRVQGDAAAGEVVRAITYISGEHERFEIDALIVTRGGGSPEDLAAFNDRSVAEAIVRSQVPVVAAIGHETDTTIAELVADLRCATPTQAAVRVSPDREALGRELDALASRLGAEISRTIRYERQRLVAAARHPVLARPDGATRLGSERVGHLRRRLAAGVMSAGGARRELLGELRVRLERRQPGAVLEGATTLQKSRERRLLSAMERALREGSRVAGATEKQLESVGPRAVLARGFSCTRTAEGRLVRSFADVAPGEAITTFLAEGRVASVVREIDPSGLLTIGDAPGGAAGPPLSRAPRASGQARPAPVRKESREDAEGDQLDLFRAEG